MPGLQPVAAEMAMRERLEPMPPDLAEMLDAVTS